jgi:membrane protein DedA with SNARE-associated domain
VTDGGTSEPPATGAKPAKWVVPAIGVAIVVLVVAMQIGNAFWARWIIESPYKLLVFNSTNKYLIGATPNTELIPMLVISTLRLMAPDPLFYAIGYIYRDRALHWGRNAFPSATQLFDFMESDHGAKGPLLDAAVLIAPNNPVCLLAGVAAMNKVRFLLIALVGTIGRIFLMRGIGVVFSDQIDAILDSVARYQMWFTIGSVAMVVAYILWQVRSRRGLIGGVEELSEEFGDVDLADPAPKTSGGTTSESE